MKRLMIVGAALALVMSLAMALCWNHVALRTHRVSVTENGRLVTDAKIYAARGTIYVTLPTWKYEAYIVNPHERIVLAALTHRFFSTRWLLISRDTPPDGVYFDKLERGEPQFNGDAVTFTSDNGATIAVRW